MPTVLCVDVAVARGSSGGVRRRDERQLLFGALFMATIAVGDIPQHFLTCSDGCAPSLLKATWWCFSAITSTGDRIRVGA